VQNPWQINDAFAPMFNEAIKIQCGNNTQTLQVAVFNSTDDDTLSEDMVDSTRKHIDVYFLESDWAIARQLKRGDTIERRFTKYSVRNVVCDDDVGVVVHAREIR
jgi:hypothetical protein